MNEMEKYVDETDFDENSSIYSQRINDGIQRFRDTHSDMRNADIVRCMKRVIFGDKKGYDNNSLDCLIRTFKEIVEVCGWTSVDEYCANFSTFINKEMHVENLSRMITDMASPEDKQECAFIRKRLLFKMVYPEFYKDNFKEILPEEIFFVSGEDKASLARAAKPVVNKIEGNEVVNSDGAIVDRIIMNTIQETFKIVGITDPVQIMEILTNKKQLKEISKKIQDEPKSSNSSAKNSKVPGCLSIINERKCYPSYLDFYFLNLPKEEQLFAVDDYIAIRNKANLPRIPLLDKLYEIVTQEEVDEKGNVFYPNREELVDSYYND